MIGRVSVAGGLALLMSSAGALGAYATDVPLLVSGSSTIMVVDTNDNGQLDDPEDCKFTAMASSDALMNSNGPIMVKADQTPVPPFDTILANCLETWTGTGFVSPGGTAGATLTAEGGEGFKQSFEFSSGPFNQALSHQQGGASAGTVPIDLRFGRAFGPSGQPIGSGFLCNADGPAAQVRADNGLTFVGQLTPFPNSSNPTHICTESIPFDIFFGQVAFHRACIPINPDGTATLSSASDPDNPFARLNFTDLPACSSIGRSAAPTMTEWGLIGLTLGLLVSGTWVLSRRRSFAHSLGTT